MPSTQFPATINLSTLTHEDGFEITGAAASDGCGRSVSSAKDINGDGIADLVIGASSASPGGLLYAGTSYVVFGKINIGSNGTLALSSLTGSNGFSLTGVEAGDYSGTSVSGMGDINGDGFDDFIIGAYSASPGGISGAGTSYVIFGKSNVGSTGTLALSGLTGSNGFSITGIASSDNSGISVSGAGDINGDGFDDLIIGAYRASPGGVTKAGSSYVVFGKSNIGSSGTLSLSSLTGSNGFSLTGSTTNAQSGLSVSGAGDINKDGFADLIIGENKGNPGGLSSAGASYVIFGKSNIGSSGTLALSSLTGSNGFVITGTTAYDYSGTSVSGAGDINGDGFDDLIIGAPYAKSNGIDVTGVSYVVFGKSNIGTSGTLALSSLTGSNGFSILGITDGDLSSYSVSSAGDINRDGIKDLIIGAYQASPGGITKAGSTYVVFGKSGIGSSGTLDLSSLDGNTGFTIKGAIANGYSGLTVSTAHDVNGDNIDDLIIGAPYTSPGALNGAGSSYVIFGKGIPSTGSSTGMSSTGGPGPSSTAGAMSSTGMVLSSTADAMSSTGMVFSSTADAMSSTGMVLSSTADAMSSTGMVLSSATRNKPLFWSAIESTFLLASSIKRSIFSSMDQSSNIVSLTSSENSHDNSIPDERLLFNTTEPVPSISKALLFSSIVTPQYHEQRPVVYSPLLENVSAQKTIGY